MSLKDGKRNPLKQLQGCGACLKTPGALGGLQCDLPEGNHDIHNAIWDSTVFSSMDTKTGEYKKNVRVLVQWGDGVKLPLES